MLLLINFYFEWALYHWATLDERRRYLHSLGNLEYCERNYSSYLEFKGLYYPFKSKAQYNKNASKIIKQNFKETSKMRLGHQKICKI